MKVLEKGSGPEGWSMETRCTGHGNGGGGCNALLLIEESDLFITHSFARDESTSHVTFRCCECDMMTDVQNSDYGERPVPSQVHRRLPRGVKHQRGGYCRPGHPLAGNP